MLNLIAARFIIGVLGCLAAAGLLYTAIDWIGDQREAKVWRQVAETVDTFNADQDAANLADAEQRALRQRLRQAALLKASPAKASTNQCLLTAEEATDIGAIK